MSQLIFPDIQPPCYPLAAALEDPALTSKMENGYVVSRPKFTRIRETFTLRWTALPAAHYQALRRFWKQETLGGSREFIWQYPGGEQDDENSGQAFVVRFSGGELKFDLVGPGLYAGEVSLQEV